MYQDSQNNFMMVLSDTLRKINEKRKGIEKVTLTGFTGEKYLQWQ